MIPLQQALIEQNASAIWGNGKWAVKNGGLLGYKRTANGKYAEREANVVRATTKRVTGRNGILTQVPIGVPAIDFANNPEGGVLVEPDATNRIRNNTMVGAVVGTPGTLPTNWETLVPAGMTRQVVSSVVENGINVIELRFFGTPSTNVIYIAFETPTGVAVTVGQEFALSAWVSRSGVFPQGTTVLGIVERNASAVYLNEGGTVLNPPLGLALERRNGQRIIANANAAFGRPYIALSDLSTSSAYDFTIRIGLPQMELGSVATSPIPTSGTIQTRNADVISRTGASALIGQTEGWMFAEIDLSNNKNIGSHIVTAWTAAPNRLQLIVNTNGTITFQAVLNGAIVIQLISSALSFGTYKIAVGYSSGNTSMFINGSVAASSLSAYSVPPCSFLNIGSNAANAAQLNDRIRAAAIGIGRPSNSFLQTITA